MSEKGVTPSQVLTVAVVAGLVALYAMGQRGEGAGADQPKKDAAMSHSYALMLCQTAVKSALVDPDSANVPYVESVGGGDEFYFAWGASTRMIKSKNRMGLEVASSASCMINGKTAEITSLTVNGTTMR